MSCDEAVITRDKERFVFLHKSSDKIFGVALFKVIIELSFLNIVLFCEYSEELIWNSHLSTF